MEKNKVLLRLSKGDFLVPFFVEKLSADSFKNSPLHSNMMTHFKYEVIDSDKYFTKLSSTSNKTLLSKLSSVEIQQINLNENQINLLNRIETCLSEHKIFSKQDLNIISGYYGTSSTNFRSASIPHAIGLIFLGSIFWNLNFSDQLISISHEIGHQELFIINTMDRIVSPLYDNNLKFAPFQMKNRPPLGRLHSLFALHRMIITSKIINSINTKKYLDLLKETISSIEEYELTTFGWNLVRTISEYHFHSQKN